MLFPDPQDPKGRGLAVFTEHMRARGRAMEEVGTELRARRSHRDRAGTGSAGRSVGCAAYPSDI
jgi:hypothetical protein